MPFLLVQWALVVTGRRSNGFSLVCSAEAITKACAGKCGGGSHVAQRQPVAASASRHQLRPRPQEH